jgi:pyruvate/2-oxoglutarate dehydrogenase complex dihydrolipoamide acyltransferase (E2) component
VSTEVLLPKLGFSMVDGIVSEWLVADGGMIEMGKPLFILESDKSSQDIESPASGRLKIMATAGETYLVGSVLAIIE